MKRHPWANGKRHQPGICVSCGRPRTSKPGLECRENRHAAHHEERRKQNNKLRRNARAAARATGTVKRYGTPEAKKRQSQRAYGKRRCAIIERLGGKCRRCGFSDYRALQVHHRNGGGAAEREALGWRYHYSIARMPAEDIQRRFDLLCANCHAIVHAEEA